MSQRPLALLLGCDGVLVHKPSSKEAARRAAHLAASREAAAAFGLAFADADFQRLAGLASAEAFARLAAEQGRAVDGAAAAAAKAAAQKRHSSGQPYAAAVAFATEAAAAGAALAVAADARADHVTAVLQKTGLTVRAVASRDTAIDAAGRLTAAAAALGLPLSACHVLDCSDAVLAAAVALGCCGVTDARTLPNYAAAAAAAEGPPPPPPPPRLRGVCKSYNDARAYGFLADAAGGADVFVHQTDICKRGFRRLVVGEEVEYAVERVEGKPRARKVTPVGAAPWEDRPKAAARKGAQGGRGSAAAARRKAGAAAGGKADAAAAEASADAAMDEE